MEWVDGHLRLTVLLLGLAVCGVLALFGFYAAVVFTLWFPAGIIYYTIRYPESEISLHRDRRDRNIAQLKGKFIQCLKDGGVEPQDGELLECLNDNPIRFIYHPIMYGATRGKIEKVVEASLSVFKAIRADVSDLPPDDEGYFGYEVIYYTETETATLTAMDTPFTMMKEKPTREKIPIGYYATGETAYITLDGVVGGMIAGQSRSGKSCAVSSIVGMLSQIGNERIILCSNKIMDYMNYAPRVELHDNPLDTLAVLKELNAEAERRKAYCLERNIKKFTDIDFTENCPHITVLLDEYAILHTSTIEDPNGKKPRKVGEEVSAEVFKAVSRNAAYGMSVFLITQRFQVGLVDSTVRSLLTSNLIGFSSGDARSDEMLFDTRAGEAPSCEIPISSKGVGYIFSEGLMDNPRLFKALYIDDKTEKRIADETAHLKPEGTNDERDR